LIIFPGRRLSCRGRGACTFSGLEKKLFDKEKTKKGKKENRKLFH